MKLLSIGTDAKTVKGEKFGYLTGILYLAPANLSGHEVCPSRSEGCTSACLFTAGRGAFKNVHDARVRKTQYLFLDRPAFLAQLRLDIIELVRKADAQGFKACVRLNGTSDLGWEGMARDIMSEFPTVQFYDYTKIANRMRRYLAGKFPANYSLTFSRSESNHAECAEILALGGNVAAVFASVPDEYDGFRVIDGDQSDLRFADDHGVIVGLKAKGQAKKDTTGFVITGVRA